MYLDKSNITLSSVLPALSLSSLSPNIDAFLVNLTIQPSVISSHLIMEMGLLDSGATGEFMHESIATKYSIPLTKLDQPIPLEVIDGQPISSGPVTYKTIPLLTRIDNHEELISFYIISSPHYGIVLGLP